jgi:hypothetical protein
MLRGNRAERMQAMTGVVMGSLWYSPQEASELGLRSKLKPGKWPAWAKAIAALKQDGELGVGDTVQRLAAAVGGEGYKALRKRIGLPCKCAERREKWNRVYAYEHNQEVEAVSGVRL